MLRTRLIIPLAVACTAFMCGCQEQASGPVEPDGLAPQFTHKDPDKVHGGPRRDDDTKVSWKFADLTGHDVPDQPSTLKQSTLQSCSGTPGSKPSNPTVEWNDGEDPKEDGCVTVTTTGTSTVTGVRLTNDAQLIVATKKGDTKVTLQFLIQDKSGPDGIQYRTDRFFIHSAKEFTGAGFILHVHSKVDIYELKGHTGGPRVKNVGTINIGDIVYR